MYKIYKSEYSTEIRKLDRRVFPADDPYDDPAAQWFVIEFRHKVVAYAAVKKVDTTAYLMRCGVMRAHRGNGLQRRLIRVREVWARERGAKWAATYVASTNYPSLNSLIRAGYTMCHPSAVGWTGADGFLTFRRRL